MLFRSGRFTGRPSHGRLLLRSATDGTGNYWELPAAEIPAFLEGTETQATAPAAVSEPTIIVHPTETRLALALTLFALAFLVVALSVWLTFRPDELDPDSLYAVISVPSEAIATRQKAVGYYVAGEDERTIEINPDGTVRYREYGPGHQLTVEHIGPGAAARRRADQAIVLRVPNLGTIELRSPDTVVYARDVYQRRPIAGSPNP